MKVRREGDGWTCQVEVSFEGRQSSHVVTVTARDVARWGRGDRDEDVEHLVRRSFDFLLEREPPSSILRRFDLGVIQRYFPEYDQEFGRQKER